MDIDKQYESALTSRRPRDGGHFRGGIHMTCGMTRGQGDRRLFPFSIRDFESFLYDKFPPAPGAPKPALPTPAPLPPAPSGAGRPPPPPPGVRSVVLQPPPDHDDDGERTTMFRPSDFGADDDDPAEGY